MELSSSKLKKRFIFQYELPKSEKNFKKSSEEISCLSGPFYKLYCNNT